MPGSAVVPGEREKLQIGDVVAGVTPIDDADVESLTAVRTSSQRLTSPLSTLGTTGESSSLMLRVALTQDRSLDDPGRCNRAGIEPTSASQ